MNLYSYKVKCNLNVKNYVSCTYTWILVFYFVAVYFVVM